VVARRIKLLSCATVCRVSSRSYCPLSATSHAAVPHCCSVHSSERDYLLGKLNSIQQKLTASKGMRQATEREKRLATAAARLKKDVPGESKAATTNALPCCCLGILCAGSCGGTSRLALPDPGLHMHKLRNYQVRFAVAGSGRF